ncbi:hypothetical protein [Parasphingorhabdus sp.]|uniref:hypothetical protein n=1 Tax=Parasphingorhabdus sp. TaxID=2709688 RepID=UPI003264122C
MAAFFEQFSNREYAALIWIAIFLIFVMAKPDIRSAFAAVLRVFFHRKVSSVFLIATIYIIGCIWLLSLFSIWTFDNLKAVIAWTLTTAFVTLLGANKIAEDSSYFSKEVRQLFALTALLTFIIEMHSYHLLLELIAVPIITVLAIMDQYSAGKPEFASIEKLLGCILPVIGGIYFIASLLQTVQLWPTLEFAEVLRDFFVPVFLSILFIPFLYLLSRYMVYESAYSILGIWIEDAKLRRQSKWLALKYFRFNIDHLQRWRREMIKHKPSTKREVRQIITDIKTMSAREKNPPEVSAENGFSPYAAMDFLKETPLKMGNYCHYIGDDWGVSSNMFEIGDSPWKNNVAYYVDGNEIAATKLTLTLNVNALGEAQEAEQLFCDMCAVLLFRAMPEAELSDVDGHIEKLMEFSELLSGRQISLKKTPFRGGVIKDGYEWKFTIQLNEERQQ